MTRLTKSQLQAALNALAAATNRAHDARAKIYEHCQTVYGTTPGEIDNDSFIDAVDGGCGTAHGMTADEFDKSMRDCLPDRAAAQGAGDL